MLQPLGKAHHFQPLGSDRRFVLGPAHRLGNLHGRDALRIAFLQDRIGARDLLDRKVSGVAPAEEPERPPAKHDNDPKGDCDFADNGHVA